MKKALFICMLVLAISAMHSFASTIAVNGYYLVSQPIPMEQNVPILHHRNPNRKYNTYLWKFTKAKEKFQLKKVASFPTGGGLQQIELWPSASLLAVSGWPWGFIWAIAFA